MNAETLRRAATELREEWDDGHNPRGTAWHRERDFHLAVADLLDRAADDHDETPCPAIDAALAVALAYLGEAS